MAKVKQGGQGKFTDVIVNNEDLVDHLETALETKEAVKKAREASKQIAELLPGVTEPTRFVVGEQYFVEVTPYEVDGHEVKGGSRRRIRVKEAAR